MRTELAWAAGLFDGEGCTYLHDGQQNLRISIGQRDDFVLRRFALAVGDGRINGPYPRKTGGPLWFYRLTGHRAVEVLAKLWPFLSPIKQIQANAVIRRLGWQQL